MSARRTNRKLSGNLPRDIEVVIGTRVDGRPGATIVANRYQADVIPLADPAMVRGLIADLREVLEHLDPTPERDEPEGELCGLCPDCYPASLEQAPCGKVHDCNLCEAKR